MCQKGWDNYRRLALIYGVDIFTILMTKLDLEQAGKTIKAWTRIIVLLWKCEVQSMNKETKITPAEEIGTIVSFGRISRMAIPTSAVDCTNDSVFDELKGRCWELVKQYADLFGTRILPNKDGVIPIDDDIVSEIHEVLISLFQMVGVQLQLDEYSLSPDVSQCILDQIRSLTDDDLTYGNVIMLGGLNESVEFMLEDCNEGEIIEKLSDIQKFSIISKEMGKRMIQVDGNYYYCDEGLESLLPEKGMDEGKGFAIEM